MSTIDLTTPEAALRYLRSLPASEEINLPGPQGGGVMKTWGSGSNTMTERPKPKTGKRGGSRPGAGRPPAAGVARPAMVSVRTTPEVAAWFGALAAEQGGGGPALEHLYQVCRLE